MSLHRPTLLMNAYIMLIHDDSTTDDINESMGR